MGGVDWLRLQLAGALLSLAAAFWKGIREKRAAGPVVFDAGGWLPLRCIGVIHCGVLIGSAIYFSSNLFGWTVIGLLVAFLLGFTFNKTQICRNGIWYMTSLLTWDEVRDIVWSTETEVQFLRFGRIAAPIKVTIPASERDHVQRFLEERLTDLPSPEVTEAAGQDGPVTRPEWLDERVVS